MLNKVIELLKNPNGFFHAVLVLVTGTVFSQVIMLAALPFLTRLYSPGDFSVLAVYASIIGLVSVAACLGLDMAVSMPESDDESDALLVLAVIFSASVSLLVALVLYFIDREFLIRIGFEELLPFLWMIPSGIFIVAAYSAIQFYVIRKKSFSDIARVRIGQSSVAASCQLGLGVMGAAPVGLLLGQMLNGGIGFFYLYYRYFSRKALKKITSSKLLMVLSKYKKFPQFTTFETLANSAGIQIPIILIASLAIGAEAGFLFLAMRVMQAPMALIGGSVAQVYLSNAPEEDRAGNLGQFTEKVIDSLVKVGVGPIIFFGIVAPSVFSILFGPDWARAGVLVTWMVPWFIFQFIASPISMSMHVKSMQKRMLAITIVGGVLRIGSLFFVATFSADWLSESYAISSGVFYFFCLCIFSACAGVPGKKLMLIFLRNIKYIFPWILFALLLSLLGHVLF